MGEDAPTERRGMIDIEHNSVRASFFGGTTQCMVFKQPLKPMPLARPVAYVELMVHGGASVGLVDSCNYRPQAHIGWERQSLGYHGDEGALYFNSGFGGQKFGPPF